VFVADDVGGPAEDPEPEPEDTKTPLEWKEQGNVHYKAKEYIASIECYSKAIRGAPEEPMFLNNRASARVMLLEFKGALEDTTAALKLAPNTVKYMEKQAKCYSSLGRKSDAIRTYNAILEIDGTNAAALRETAELRQVEQLKKNAVSAIGDTQYRIAVSFLDQALKLTPADDGLKLLQAEAYLAMDKPGDAERICANILRKNKQHTEALYVRGVVKYNIGETDAALQHFKMALGGDPDHARSRVKLKQVKLMVSKKAAGTAALKARKYDEAVEFYTEAIAVDPTNQFEVAKLYFNRCTAYMKMEKHEESLSDCESALKIDQKYIKALVKKVKILIELEKFDEAVQFAEKSATDNEGERDMQEVLREAKVELKKSKRKNYYKILGVSKHIADPELKKAYKKACLRTHPDRCRDESKKEEAEAAFKDVNEAYSVLSDAQKREAYDQGADIEEINQGGGGHGHGHGGGMGGMSPDMFAQMFGGRGGGGMGGGGGGFHFG
jgi:DnaJ family protein C protein 7